MRCLGPAICRRLTFRSPTPSYNNLSQNTPDPRVTHDRSTPKPETSQTPYQRVIAASHYGLLGISASASAREIRQAYRELSKQYHPDTTALPREVAIERFRQLNEAYATLSSPERRSTYDQKIGYSPVSVVQPLPNLNISTAKSRPVQSSSAYLDPTDRPLSAGEVFALFILGLTFLACLVLAIAIGLTRGEAVFEPFAVQPPAVQQVTVPAPSPALLPPPEQAVKTAQTTSPPSISPSIDRTAPTPIKPTDPPRGSIEQAPRPAAAERQPSIDPTYPPIP